MIESTSAENSKRFPALAALTNGGVWGVILFFGLMAFILIYWKMYLPVPGTQVVTDVRENFVTVGAALTGPIGGMLVGLLAGFYDPYHLWAVALANHLLGGLWVGWAYKKFYYAPQMSLLRLWRWLLIIVVYYFVIFLPVSTLLVRYIPTLGELAGVSGLGTREVFTLLLNGIIPEFLMTSFYTSMVWLALPARYRKPLW